VRLNDLNSLVREETSRFTIPLLELALVEEHGVTLHLRFSRGSLRHVDPEGPQNVFRAGSLSKMINAVAIVRLAEAGRLDLDAPIANICPDLAFHDPFSARTAVTLRHLLTHTSGLVRESPVGNYYDASAPTIEQCVRSMVGSTLVHPPGTRAKYSNIGPTIAAWVAEKATGTPWLEMVERDVLQPLRMDDSAFTAGRRPAAAIATEGFMSAADGSAWPAPRFELGTIPSGGLRTTSLDLAAFLRFLLAGGEGGGRRILGEASMKELFRPVVASPGGFGFGMGFVLGATRSSAHVGHGGAVYGFSADFAAFPSERVGIIVLNNLDCTGGVNAKIRGAALEYLLTQGRGRSVTSRADRRPEPEDLDSLAGTYRSGSTTVEVEAAADGLALRHAGVRNRLRRIDGDRYETDDRMSWGTTVAFERDGGSRAPAVAIGGAQFVRESEPPAPESGSATVGISLQRFCGEYGPAYAGLRFSLRGGRLACRIEWFYEYDLSPAGELRFAFPDHGMFEGEELSFVEGPDGGISAVLLSGIWFERAGGGEA
jgi:CubicO group peptidase (beta-lactamase class C family)